MPGRTGPARPAIPQDELPTLSVPVGPDDHARGPLGAPYVLVEYGDYECPHCGEFRPLVDELHRDLGDDFCFVFRNFPNAAKHPHALAAAAAAEAAGMQAKFWLMHDRLFEHQDDLSDERILHLAKDLPVEMATYQRDLTSGSAARRVEADRLGGVQSGVVETPTLFVNGRMYVDSHELVPLLAALRSDR